MSVCMHCETESKGGGGWGGGQPLYQAGVKR